MTADSLIASEMLLTLNAAGVGIWSVETATGEVTLDATGRELFGVEPDGRLFPDILLRRLHRADLDKYRDAIAHALETGVFECDYRVMSSEGEVRHISGRGRMRFRPDGSTVLKGVCIDVTRSQELESELRETRERMQRLADGVPGLFACLDRQYRVQFLSAQYEQWFGVRRPDALGRHIAELVGKEAFLQRKPMYDEVLAGESLAYEEARRAVDGTDHYFAFQYQPYRNTAGEIAGVLSLGIDITDRRRAERALEAQSHELARSNQDLEQFAYVASHDLKAPLRAMDVLVDWLREDLESHDIGDVQENLRLLKQRSGRLHRLLDDLLAYSRAGRKGGQATRFDSGELVRDIISLLAPPPGMEFGVPSNLPVLNSCRAALEQVLRNLINNAIKHHPTAQGRIQISAQLRDDEVLFAVEDDGAGIPAEYADKVFQMFQTLRPRDEVEGSGMGLAIVKRIVEGQGGRIWFHAAPGGQGTVFKFTWKQLAGAPSAAAGEERDEQSDGQDRQHLAG